MRRFFKREFWDKEWSVPAWYFVMLIIIGMASLLPTILALIGLIDDAGHWRLSWAGGIALGLALRIGRPGTKVLYPYGYHPGMLAISGLAITLAAGGMVSWFLVHVPSHSDYWLMAWMWLGIALGVSIGVGGLILVAMPGFFLMRHDANGQAGHSTTDD